jgi:cell division protein ZapA
MAYSEHQISGVIVQIFGDEYQISSQSDAAEVQRIAAYVDRKMRALADQHAGRVPKASLAVLAAMEIASELFGAMQEQSRLTEKARENLDRLTRLVDERASMFSTLTERRGTAAPRVLHEARLDPKMASE